MSEKNLLFKDRKGNGIASAVAGGAILVFLAVVIFLMPEPTPSQHGILRFFIAICAAMLATFFIGGVALQGTLAGSKIGAGGGFALFVLIQFVFDPLKIQTIAADVAPQIVPPRQEVKQAQEVLSRLGEYSGAVDGIPGAATRNAISKFQAARGLAATSYVDAATERVFKDAEKKTSVFEGQDIVSTPQQRALVSDIMAKNGLKTALATWIIFDTVVYEGPGNAKRFATNATEKNGGSPLTGLSERNWLLAYLQARTEHLEKTFPGMAKGGPGQRITKLRAQVEAMPQ